MITKLTIVNFAKLTIKSNFNCTPY